MVFEPSLSLGIISGLKETFIRDIVERINKADIRPDEQSEKMEFCRENLWMEWNTVERAIKTEVDIRTE